MIVSAATVATTLLALTPTETKVPDVSQTKKDASLCLVSLSPLNLFSPLLNPLFMSAAASYSFIKAMAVAMKLATAVQQLLSWTR